MATLLEGHKRACMAPTTRSREIGAVHGAGGIAPMQDTAVGRERFDRGGISTVTSFAANARSRMRRSIPLANVTRERPRQIDKVAIRTAAMLGYRLARCEKCGCREHAEQRERTHYASSLGADVVTIDNRLPRFPRSSHTDERLVAPVRGNTLTPGVLCDSGERLTYPGAYLSASWCRHGRVRGDRVLRNSSSGPSHVWRPNRAGAHRSFPSAAARPCRASRDRRAPRRRRCPTH